MLRHDLSLLPLSLRREAGGFGLVPPNEKSGIAVECTAAAPISVKMHPELTTNEANEPVAIWHLPYVVRLGSSVRSKGIFQFVRLRLPATARKSLTVRAGELTLTLPAANAEPLIAAVSKALEGIEERPILPREIEDILSIKSSERHRWLRDGRLPSAGTKTVTLRGRAKSITFHVFDPRVVQDLLERDTVVEWREQDAITAAENRREAAFKRRLTSPEARRRTHRAAEKGEAGLKGWAEFERDGPLR